MLIAAIVIGVAVGAFVKFFVPEKFSSTVDFYVINTNTSYDYTTSSLLSASEYLIKDYVKLIKSDEILNVVAANLNEGKAVEDHIDAKALRSMISASSEEGTSLFTIKVTHTDPAFAREVAAEIMEQAPTLVTEIAKPKRLTTDYLVTMVIQTMIDVELQNGKENGTVANRSEAEKIVAEKCSRDEIAKYLEGVGMNDSLPCFKAVNNPVEDTSADSPSVTKYAAIGAILAAMIVYLGFAASGFFKANLLTEEDIKQFVDRPVIGTIPHWESSSRSIKK